MKRTHFVKTMLLWGAVFGLMMPTSVMAAPPTQKQMLNIGLRDGGTLIGRLVRADGTAIANATVSLQLNSKEAAKNTTDAKGMFAFRGLQGGTCQLVASQDGKVLTGAEHGLVCRVWTPGTAPPKSQEGILLVAGENVVRGQALKHWLANPWVIAGIVATAVAVPVIVHNTKSPSSP